MSVLHIHKVGQEWSSCLLKRFDYIQPISCKYAKKRFKSDLRRSMFEIKIKGRLKSRLKLKLGYPYHQLDWNLEFAQPHICIFENITFDSLVPDR